MTDDLPDFSDTEDDTTELEQSFKAFNTSNERPLNDFQPSASDSAAEGQIDACSSAVSEVSEEVAVSTAARAPTPVSEDLQNHQLLAWSTSKSMWRPFAARKDGGTGDGKVGEVRVITYNVWFSEDTGRRLRHRALFKLCLTSKREVDIICLQEMTVAYDELLGLEPFDKGDPLRTLADRSTGILKRQWLVSDFLPQSILFKRQIWFGTVILINRAFAARITDNMTVRSMPLPSACSRKLHYVEMMYQGQRVLRIATFHLDGHPTAIELRKRQFGVIAKHLCNEGVPVIICGDSNIVSFEEAKGVTSSPFRLIDAMEAIDPAPTWNTTYVVKDGNTFRIDLVLLSPGFTVKSGENLGAKPFPVPEGVGKPRRLGRGGQVYPSDHLGVFVHAQYLKDEVA